MGMVFWWLEEALAEIRAGVSISPSAFRLLQIMDGTETRIDILRTEDDLISNPVGALRE